ncbi:MAG TPA: DUF72 domain-containing protein [bacterium]|jgi:uncharacterized protein YecE (DUF72 family)
MPVYIGTAGYSYPEWVGQVYPEGTSSAKMLEMYARMFDVVEINATFYRPPGKSMFEKYPDRTGGDLKIVVKLHGNFTHERIAENDDASIFDTAVKPIVDSGQFAGYLAQFPQSFHCTSDALHWIEKLREFFPDSPVVCEFRHKSWWNKDVLKFMKDMGISVASVDSPDLSELPPRAPTFTSEPGYLRLHGRNKDDWYGKGMVPRYTYDYSEAELHDLMEKTDKILKKAEGVIVIFNNHPYGYAANNANSFLAMLKKLFPDQDPGGKIKGNAPQGELFG